jgi:predicted lipid-binding transport protein (Tim44 family)
MMKRVIPCLYLVLALLLLLTCAVDGRVGGGESYSGGGSHGGGGGGGGGLGELIFLLVRLLVWLIIRHPALGIPLTIAIIALIIYGARKGAFSSETQAQPYSSQYDYCATMPPSPENLNQKIAALKNVDPNFSRPLFMDFLQMIYVRIHHARGDHNWESLKPYIDPAFLSALAEESKDLARVERIVIGSLKILDIVPAIGGYTRISCEFEANFAETADGKTWNEFYSKERWSFRRKAGVLSKGPEEIVKFACPSCGSPAELKSDGTCPYCGNVVNQGNFHWQLFDARTITRGAKPPLKLSLGGIEEGTDLPTVYQCGFETQRKNFQMRYPSFNWQIFENRAREVFMNLQDAWTKRQWELARPLETDYLFSTHRFWMERYTEENLTNKLEDIEITSVVPVKIEQDAFYESITVRISAKMKDYIVDRNDKVVAGNKNVKRSFSEYWTFIRRAGFALDSETDEKNCPQCGAPMKISMAGICEYCNAKITSGTFYWTLALIEQDEVYRG